jgi:hypothetical protein
LGKRESISAAMMSGSVLSCFAISDSKRFRFFSFPEVSTVISAPFSFTSSARPQLRHEEF